MKVTQFVPGGELLPAGKLKEGRRRESVPGRVDVAHVARGDIGLAATSSGPAPIGSAALATQLPKRTALKADTMNFVIILPGGSFTGRRAACLEGRAQRYPELGDSQMSPPAVGLSVNREVAMPRRATDHRCADVSGFLICQRSFHQLSGRQRATGG